MTVSQNPTNPPTGPIPQQIAELQQKTDRINAILPQVVSKSIAPATPSTSGLMSATDKQNLDNLNANAMLKSTYDTDNDGIVDNAAKIGGQALTDLDSRYASSSAFNAHLADYSQAIGGSANLHDKINTVIDIRDYPKIAPEVTDDGRITRAIADAISTGKPLWFEPGATYICNSKLRFQIGANEVIGNSATIDFSGMPSGSGYAVEFVPYTTDVNNSTRPISNLTIKGKADENWLVDGVFLGRPNDMSSGNTAQASFIRLYIDGFRDNLYIGNQTWCNSFFDLKNLNFKRYGINVQCLTNAGENIRFFGGVIANGINSSGTACAIYIPSGTYVDFYFHSTSFDYCNTFFAQYSGLLSFYGCHMENKTNAPMGKCTYLGGPGSMTTCNIVGCTFGPGPLGDLPEDPNGRPWLFELYGDKIAFVMLGGNSELYGRSTEIVHVTAGQPFVKIELPMPNVQTGNTPRICGSTNVLYNGDFEQGNTNGWNVNGSTGYTYTIDNTVYHSGSKSLRCNSTVGSSTSTITQNVIARPGEMILVSGWIKSATTQGYVEIQVRFFTESMVQIGQKNLSSQDQSGTKDWTRVSDWARVPLGCYKAQIVVYFYNLLGDVWVDDIEAWVI